MLKETLLALLGMGIIFVLIFTLSWCKLNSRLSREEEMDIKANEWEICDDDCYMCDLQIKCQKSAMKENR